VLDLGCGTGIVAFEVAAASGPGTTVIGIDLSEGMLRTARDKLAQAAAHPGGTDGRLSFRTGDAEALALPDGFADGYVSLHAFRHFPHPEKASAEAFRVLAPGGRIAVAIGSGPRLFTLQGAARAVALALRKAREAAGRELGACEQLERLVDRHLRAGPEVELATWSAFKRETSGLLAGLLQGAGFVDIRRNWVGTDFRVATVEEFWQLQTTISTHARKRMAVATAAELAALKAAFRQECEAVLARGGRMVYRVGAALVTARKSG
jgi:ubiquinone/menaquinone biosynthesis C-methylase UbiE